MIHRIFGAAALSALFSTLVLVAADPASPDELAKDLGSTNFRAREAATKNLWKMGEKARPALEAAAKGTNVEAAGRAQSILDKFEWGIFPDTPPETLELITLFRGGTYQQQLDVVMGLLKKGPDAVPTLRALLAKDFAREPNSPGLDLRLSAFTAINGELRRSIPVLIRDGKLDAAEELLSLQTLGPISAGHLDYTTFAVARGHGKQAIAALEAERVNGKAYASQPLAFLYRAAGDTAKARTLIDILATEQPNIFTRLREGFLLETGDWVELTKEPTADMNSPLGMKAFRLRKAGQTKEANEVLESAKTETPSIALGTSIDEHAMALLLNERPDDGIERLKSTRTAPHIMADLLVARLEFASALELINAGLKAKDEPEDAVETIVDPQVKILYSLKRGRIMAQLGQRDAAAQVFAALNDEVNAASAFHVTQAVKAEARSGFNDLAAELVGKLQAEQDKTEGDRRARPYYGSQEPYEILFDADADAARYWWEAMRKAKPDEKPGKRMRDVRDLLIGKMPKEAIAKWIKTSSEQAIPDPRSVEGFRWAMGRAAAYRMIGEPKEAIATLVAVADAWAEKSALDAETWLGDLGTRSWVFGVDEKFRLWIDLGDLLMAEGDAKGAAKRYEQGWKRYPDNPVPLYLAGVARIKAGEDAEGKKLKDASHLVALGNARARGRFLEELINRAAPHPDLKLARDTARQCAWAEDRNIGNVWNQIGRASIILKDYATAVEANSRAIYYVLRTPGVAYVEGVAYLNVPVLLRSLTARRLLAEGKQAEAMAAARATLAIMPSHSEVVIAMVPELDKLKQKKDADELFNLFWKPFVKLAADNPESGWARFNAAWVAAGCNRELDAALVYAKKAVETEPANRSFRECLAEVQFRMGKREPAAKIAAELFAEEPRNWHYQRQIERYKSAPVDSPLPDGADD